MIPHIKVTIMRETITNLKALDCYTSSSQHFGKSMKNSMENIHAGVRVFKVKSSSDWVTNQFLPVLNRLQVLFFSIFHLSLLLEVRFN